MRTNTGGEPRRRGASQLDGDLAPGDAWLFAY
jgi:hypothetical protein